MSFYPSTRSPEQFVIDRMEALLRNGDPLLHNPMPPSWPDGPCPAGHYCIPEGAVLFRYEVPEEMECAVSIIIAADGDNIERHLEDDRFWLIPVEVLVGSTRDEEYNGDMVALANDLLQLFTVDTAVDTAPTRMSSDALHVWYIQEKDIKPVGMVNGRHSHMISFTLFCAGKVAPPP